MIDKKNTKKVKLYAFGPEKKHQILTYAFICLRLLESSKINQKFWFSSRNNFKIKLQLEIFHFNPHLNLKLKSNSRKA